MEVFCAVVDAGGFDAAAKTLGLSQSSISKSLAALEQRLGVSLLNRTTRDQRVSLEGERYLENCRQVLELIESSEDDLTAKKLGATGLLKISVPVSFGLDQISPILPKFLAENPCVKIELSVTDRVENLIDGKIDVAIRMGELEDSNLISRKLCALDRIIVASPDYLKNKAAPIHPTELSEHNCLLWKGNAHHLNKWPLFDGNSRVTVNIDGNFLSNNGLALIAACLDGVGIMRIAEHVAAPLLKSGELIQLLGDYQRIDNQEIHVVFQRKKQNLTRVRNFVDFCVKEFQTLNWI
jgi:DNA-binding transcriptional LysR family regulator